MRLKKVLAGVLAGALFLTAIPATEIIRAEETQLVVSEGEESLLDRYGDGFKDFVFENSAPCFAYEKDGVIEDLKSSDESILTVELGTINGDDDHKYILTRTYGKPGNVKITFNYTWNGTTRDYSIDCTFYEYTNGFQSFKIGKNNYTKKYNKTFYFEPKKMKGGKLSIKASSGWTLEKIRIFDKAERKDTEVRNNSKVKLNKNTILFVTMKHEESGIEQDFRLGSY